MDNNERIAIEVAQDCIAEYFDLLEDRQIEIHEVMNV